MTPGTPFGAAATLFAWRPAGLALNLAGLMVMSRLLDPAAFGVYAPLAAVYMAAMMAVDFGAASNLLRRPGRALDEAALSAAAGLWSAMAAAVFCLFCLAALALGGPHAAPLLVLSLALPLAVPIFVAETRLRRRLVTPLLAASEVGGMAAGLVMGALAAAAGLGPVALAVAMTGERAAYLALLLRRGAVGRLRPRASGWRQHLGFGAAFTPSQLLPQASIALRLSVVGALLGAPALGLFSRAETVARINDRLTLATISPIALPMMADLSGRGHAPGDIYLGKIALLSAVCWPAAAFVAVMADPLVAVLLGGDWSETVPLVRILAGLGLAAPFTKMATKVFALMDAEVRALKLQAVQQAIALTLVVGAAFVSIAAVCWATLASQLIKAARIAASLEDLTGASRRRMGRVLLAAAGLSAATAAGPALLLWRLPDFGALPTLLAALLLAGAAWLAGLAATAHPLWRHLTGALPGRLRRR